MIEFFTIIVYENSSKWLGFGGETLVGETFGGGTFGGETFGGETCGNSGKCSELIRVRSAVAVAGGG